MRIIIIVGLPGSGKTYLAKRLVDKMQGVLLDDVNNHGGLDTIKQYINKQAPQIIITDPHLCRREAQLFAKKFFSDYTMQYMVEWIFFENNVEACLKNIKRRTKKGDARNVSGMLHVSKTYFIPDDITPLRVWQED